jgi:hypothetical protein
MSEDDLKPDRVTGDDRSQHRQDCSLRRTALFSNLDDIALGSIAVRVGASQVTDVERAGTFPSA